MLRMQPCAETVQLRRHSANAGIIGCSLILKIHFAYFSLQKHSSRHLICTITHSRLCLVLCNALRHSATQ